MAKKAKQSTGSKMTMAKALASLAKLNKAALQKKYKEVFGKDTKSDNVVNLRAGIARKLAGAPKAAKSDAPTEARTSSTASTSPPGGTPGR